MFLIDKFLIFIFLFCSSVIKRVWLIKEFGKFGICLEINRVRFVGGYFFVIVGLKIFVEGNYVYLFILVRKVIFFVFISY